MNIQLFTDSPMFQEIHPVRDLFLSIDLACFSEVTNALENVVDMRSLMTPTCYAERSMSPFEYAMLYGTIEIREKFFEVIKQRCLFSNDEKNQDEYFLLFSAVDSKQKTIIHRMVKKNDEERLHKVLMFLSELLRPEQIRDLLLIQDKNDCYPLQGFVEAADTALAVDILLDLSNFLGRKNAYTVLAPLVDELFEEDTECLQIVAQGLSNSDAELFGELLLLSFQKNKKFAASLLSCVNSTTVSLLLYPASIVFPKETFIDFLCQQSAEGYSWLHRLFLDKNQGYFEIIQLMINTLDQELFFRQFIAESKLQTTPLHYLYWFNPAGCLSVMQTLNGRLGSKWLARLLCAPLNWDGHSFLVNLLVDNSVCEQGVVAVLHLIQDSIPVEVICELLDTPCSQFMNRSVFKEILVKKRDIVMVAFTAIAISILEKNQQKTGKILSYVYTYLVRNNTQLASFFLKSLCYSQLHQVWKAAPLFLEMWPEECVERLVSYCDDQGNGVLHSRDVCMNPHLVRLIIKRVSPKYFHVCNVARHSPVTLMILNGGIEMVQLLLQGVGLTASELLTIIDLQPTDRLLHYLLQHVPQENCTARLFEQTLSMPPIAFYGGVTATGDLGLQYEFPVVFVLRRLLQNALVKLHVQHAINCDVPLYVMQQIIEKVDPRSLDYFIIKQLVEKYIDVEPPYELCKNIVSLWVQYSEVKKELDFDIFNRILSRYNAFDVIEKLLARLNPQTISKDCILRFHNDMKLTERTYIMNFIWRLR